MDQITPEDAGLERAPLKGVRGGDVHENAERFKALLSGKASRAEEDIVILNAAALLHYAGGAFANDGQATLGRADLLAYCIRPRAQLPEPIVQPQQPMRSWRNRVRCFAEVDQPVSLERPLKSVPRQRGQSLAEAENDMIAQRTQAAAKAAGSMGDRATSKRRRE